MPKISGAPSPRTFADAMEKEVLTPAAEKAVGANGVLDAADDARIDALDGLDASAKPFLKDAVALTGQPSPDVSTFVAAARARVFDEATAAAGADGRLSSADAASLSPDVRLAFFALKNAPTPTSPTTPTPTTPTTPTTTPTTALVIPAHPGVSFSDAVILAVCAEYGLTDVGALIDAAKALDDGNLYLKKSELVAAAEVLRANPVVVEPEGAFTFSENVITSVMDQFAITDRTALLALGTRVDVDGNRYLKRSELEAAAKILTGLAVELGIISDIDKTVMPPSSTGQPLKDPYPGVATLYRILERGLDESGAAGDMHYVTARDPDRAAEVPAWLDLHELPAGTLDTGIGVQPWIAEDEKVRDVEKHFEAAPEQKFVLFGDTSHRDPDVYKRIRAKYPDRVLAIVIHDVKNIAATRTEGMHLVKNYADGAAKLFKDGVLDEPSARAVMIAAQLEGHPITDAEITALIDAHRP